MYRYLIFDLDGTLINSIPEITASLNHALKACGLEEVTDGRDLSWFVGPPLRDGFRRLLDTSDDSLVETLVTAYRDMYKDASLDSKLYPGMRNLITDLSKRRTLALATTKPTLYATKILEHLGLSGSFGMVLGCELDGRRSTKEELIGCIIDSYGGAPTDYLFIGDRRDDVAGARKNGIDSVAVLYGYGSVAEIEGARPTFIAATVVELDSLLRELIPTPHEAVDTGYRTRV